MTYRPVGIRVRRLSTRRFGAWIELEDHPGPGQRRRLPLERGPYSGRTAARARRRALTAAGGRLYERGAS